MLKLVLHPLYIEVGLFPNYSRSSFERGLQTRHHHRWFSSILPTILALTAAALAKLGEHHWDQSVRWQHRIRRWCNICLPHVLMIISPIMTISNLNLKPQVFRNIENHKSHRFHQMLHGDELCFLAFRRRTLRPFRTWRRLQCGAFGRMRQVAAGRQHQSGLWEVNKIVLERSWKHRKYGYEMLWNIFGF